jgi:hypothetical protein
MSLQDGRQLLERAKSEYRRALRVVDSHLRSACAQDPKRIPEARDIQAEYGTGFSGVKLTEMFQPPPPETDAHGQPVYPPEGPAAYRPELKTEVEVPEGSTAPFSGAKPLKGGKTVEKKPAAEVSPEQPAGNG